MKYHLAMLLVDVIIWLYIRIKYGPFLIKKDKK